RFLRGLREPRVMLNETNGRWVPPFVSSPPQQRILHMPLRDNLPRRPVSQPTRPAARQPGQKPPPPPVVAYEDVVVACGHVEKFGLFEDKKDKFRAGRRQKLMGRLCKTCRAQREKEVQEAAEKRRAERAKNQAGQGPKARKGPKRQTGRLPDRSRFAVQFDAAAEAWSGTLTVPGDGEALTFTATTSGV